jgi:hypothetical protein
MISAHLDLGVAKDTDDLGYGGRWALPRTLEPAPSQEIALRPEPAADSQGPLWSNLVSGILTGRPPPGIVIW